MINTNRLINFIFLFICSKYLFIFLSFENPGFRLNIAKGYSMEGHCKTGEEGVKTDSPLAMTKQR